MKAYFGSDYNAINYWLNVYAIGKAAEHIYDSYRDNKISQRRRLVPVGGSAALSTIDSGVTLLELYNKTARLYLWVHDKWSDGIGENISRSGLIIFYNDLASLKKAKLRMQKQIPAYINDHY